MSRKNRTHRTTAARRRRRRKPVLVKAGSVVVKIRQSPLVINGKKYPSFIVDYYANGRRYRERRNTARKARALADAVVAKLVKGELQALELTGEDRRIYLLSVENLKELGVGLDAATREYAEAKKICKNADLREVARFRQRYAQTELKKGHVPDLVKMLLADLARDKRGEYHIRDLDLRLGQFAKDFPGRIDEVQTRPIDDWLGGLRSQSRHGQGKEISGVRTEEMAIMTWENVAFKKGYIILRKEITKKKKRRIIRIWKNLRAWLDPFAGLEGKICWQWSTPQAMFQAWDRVAKKMGIQAGANRFRNSYTSYRVAQTGDTSKVSRETGNSPEVIEEDYLELATEEDAEKWFRIRPSPKRLAELRACAKEWAENPTALLNGDEAVE